MPDAHECPDCERTFTGAACPRCNWTPPISSVVDLRCSWNRDRGSRCYMLGTLGTKAARCTWHTLEASDPRHTANFDEFERWVTSLHDAGYCADWTHYRADALWQAVRGVLPLPERVVACAASGCRHRTDLPASTDWRAAIARAAAADTRPARGAPSARVGALLTVVAPGLAVAP